jgi:hypothetical protein
MYKKNLSKIAILLYVLDVGHSSLLAGVLESRSFKIEKIDTKPTSSIPEKKAPEKSPERSEPESKPVDSLYPTHVVSSSEQTSQSSARSTEPIQSVRRPEDTATKPQDTSSESAEQKPITPSQDKLAAEFEKALVSDIPAAWVNPLDKPLGQMISTCLQQEIQNNLPSVKGANLEKIAYSKTYADLALYEHLKFRITDTKLQLSQQQWQDKRNEALKVLSLTSLNYDPEYQRLIRAFNLAKTALEEKLGVPLGSPPSLTNTACEKLIFKLVNQYLQEAIQLTIL